jgi:hypothetical protein
MSGCVGMGSPTAAAKVHAPRSIGGTADLIGDVLSDPDLDTEAFVPNAHPHLLADLTPIRTCPLLPHAGCGMSMRLFGPALTAHSTTVTRTVNIPSRSVCPIVGRCRL